MMAHEKHDKKGAASRSVAWPYRQDDPTWSDVLMWDRALVIKAAALNGFSKAEACELLHRYPEVSPSIDCNLQLGKT
jgi:hypothetical protein